MPVERKHETDKHTSLLSREKRDRRGGQTSGSCAGGRMGGCLDLDGVWRGAWRDLSGRSRAGMGQSKRQGECRSIKPAAKLGKLWRNQRRRPSHRSPGPFIPSFVIATRIKPPRSFRASSSFSQLVLVPGIQVALRQLIMAPGAVVASGSTEGFMHLLDPNRKWYNNKRCVLNVWHHFGGRH